MIIKKCYPIFIITIIVLMNCTWKAKVKDLIGIWKGNFYGTEFTLEFREGNQIIMAAQRTSVPGTYKINFTMKPIQIDITNQHKVNEKGILEFIDRDHIRFESGGPDKPYPSSFSEDKSFILRRIEKSDFPVDSLR